MPARQSCCLTILIMIVFGLALQACDQSGAPSSRRIEQAGQSQLLIRNVAIIDALSGMRRDQDILVVGERIAAVGRTGTIDVDRSVTIVEGEGRYLIPGLWDAHVHLTFDPLIGASALPVFVANGVTNVFDTGGRLGELQPILDIADEIGPRSPRVFFAGPLVDGVPVVYDGSPPHGRALGVEVDGPEQGIVMVDRLADAGVHAIKAYEMLSPETFMAIINRARDHGLPVTGHIPLAMDAVEVAELGMTNLQHGRNIELSCAANWQELLRDRIKALRQGRLANGWELRKAIHAAQRTPAIDHFSPRRCLAVMRVMAEKGVIQTPTLANSTLRLERPFADAEWRQTFAPFSDRARAAMMMMAERLTAETYSKAQIKFEDWTIRMVHMMHEEGVPIMAGTDTPIRLLTPGYSLHRELVALVNAGLTPLEALEAATVTPARFFGLEDDMGTIEVGKLADFVLLRESPLQDITNTTTIDAVMKAGHYYDASGLKDLLANAKELAPDRVPSP